MKIYAAWSTGLLLLLLLMTPFFSRASHMIGGDITYRCLGNNVFEITLTLYQDCLFGEPQAIQQDDPAYYTIFTAGSNPVMVAEGNIRSLTTETVDPNFNNACINNYPNTCLRKQVFRFTRTLEPSSRGYYIVYQRCCRNASINNIVNPGNVGVTYLALIPPFVNGECPNNSAVFKTLPPQIICSNNPFVYDFSATDADADSLSYELCAAHPGASITNPLPPTNGPMTPPPYPSVNYMPPYSATIPMSGNPPLQINPITGLMSGTPNVIGRFVVTVCVNEWRNGSIINTVSRDVQFVVTNCTKAVVADIPELPDEPNTYIVECKSNTVKFSNNSSGGFSYFWDFGVNGATSTEEEPSFTYPDTGTYVVKLVVNQGSTCPDSIVRLVKVYPFFKADFSWSGQLCPGVPIQFRDSSLATFPPTVSWNWDFGDGNSAVQQHPVHTYAIPGGEKQVTLIAKTTLGCRDTVTKTLPLSYFAPHAGNDTIIVLGYPFTLKATGGQYYQWSPADYLSDPNIANPAVDFPDTGRYTFILTATNDEGCLATDTILVWVVGSENIFVPNAFSPNGDGINDFLEPRIIGIAQINNFQVFNRWGQRVYSSLMDNYPQWDGSYNGRPADLGTYFWMMNVTDAMGNKQDKKGDVILIR